MDHIGRILRNSLSVGVVNNHADLQCRKTTTGAPFRRTTSVEEVNRYTSNSWCVAVWKHILFLQDHARLKFYQKALQDRSYCGPQVTRENQKDYELQEGQDAASANDILGATPTPTGPLKQKKTHRQGCQILDLGSGSGILAILAAKQYPNADVVAVEGNPEIAVIAQQAFFDFGVSARIALVARPTWQIAREEMQAALDSIGSSTASAHSEGQLQRRRPDAIDNGALPAAGSSSVILSRQLVRRAEDQKVRQENDDGFQQPLFDLLVTETFGSLLLGEYADLSIADAVRRFGAHAVLPENGRQYMQLVTFSSARQEQEDERTTRKRPGSTSERDENQPTSPRPRAGGKDENTPSRPSRGLIFGDDRREAAGQAKTTSEAAAATRTITQLPPSTRSFLGPRRTSLVRDLGMLGSSRSPLQATSALSSSAYLDGRSTSSSMKIPSCLRDEAFPARAARLDAARRASFTPGTRRHVPASELKPLSSLVHDLHPSLMPSLFQGAVIGRRRSPGNKLASRSKMKDEDENVISAREVVLKEPPARAFASADRGTEAGSSDEFLSAPFEFLSARTLGLHLDFSMRTGGGSRKIMQADILVAGDGPAGAEVVRQQTLDAIILDWAICRDDIKNQLPDRRGRVLVQEQPHSKKVDPEPDPATGTRVTNDHDAGAYKVYSTSSCLDNQSIFTPRIYSSSVETPHNRGNSTSQMNKEAHGVFKANTFNAVRELVWTPLVVRFVTPIAVAPGETLRVNIDAHTGELLRLCSAAV
ncbi:unnamed protein product [Amoebophrya sp. A120]|nr:unnamed protein product [Amoebophrya sp. A120]|eukprot:GSA120T00022756001.1